LDIARDKVGDVLRMIEPFHRANHQSEMQPL